MDLDAEATLAGIKLSWSHSPDADLSHYKVYRSEVSGEGYEVMVKQPQTSISIETQLVEQPIIV